MEEAGLLSRRRAVRTNTDAGEKLNAPSICIPTFLRKLLRKAYFEGGLPGQYRFLLAAPGWGWHSELALHVLRLVLSARSTGTPPQLI